mgnify:CR=1 FL=1
MDRTSAPATALPDGEVVDPTVVVLEAEQAVSAIAPAVAAAPDRKARRETVGRTSGVVGTCGL